MYNNNYKFFSFIIFISITFFYYQCSYTEEEKGHEKVKAIIENGSNKKNAVINEILSFYYNNFHQSESSFGKIITCKKFDFASFQPITKIKEGGSESRF